MDASIRRTQVDLSGLMRVLGQHLYSTPNVVVRELIQNAHDSCVRRGAGDPNAPAPLIRVTADAQAGQLHIEDNGAGLTADELENYLAVIGRGQTGESREEGVEGLIGMFGLGFLSAYVVAETTEVWTASARAPGVAWRFISRSGQSFTLEPGPTRPVGTRVSLTLKPAHRDLARPPILSALVRRYCRMLPIAIELTHDGERLGASPPPWRAPGLSPLRRRKLALELAQQFESGFAPLCTLDLEDDDEDEDARVSGVLWIQDGSSYGNADNRRVSLFVRGMLVTDDARWVLPDWATFAGAVIESGALSPTASREDIQRDASFRRARQVVTTSLISGLARLASEEPRTWRRVLRRHNEALLGAALCDAQLFDLVADQLTVPTSMGDLHVKTILRRSGGTIHVTRAQRVGVEGLMFRARAIPVVQGTRYGALAFSREYTARRGGGLHIIGEREDPAGLGVRLAQETDPRLEEWFGTPSTKVVAARFEPPTLPFVPIVDRAQELKQRIESDRADAAIGAAALALARSFTAKIDKGARQRLYVNLDCPAIQGVLAATRPATIELGVQLLRAVLGMLAAHDDLEELPSLDSALADFNAALSTVTTTSS